MTRDTGSQDKEGAFADLDHAPLTHWLVNNAPHGGEIQSLAKFPGGQSNPTYRLRFGGEDYVLRRKPFGKILPSAHAVEREFRLISALHPLGLPVAKPYALCEDEAVIGAPFYIMGMVEGRTFWDGTLPDCAKEERRPIYLALVDALAQLHAVDPAEAGLSDYGAPGNYFERQVGRWTKQYRASQTDDLPEVEQLIEFLPATVPEQERTSIIHGDYRIDNLIYAQGAPEVRAILDWELSTLGDPLADFTYLAMNWALPRTGRNAQLGGLDLEELGIPSVEEITQRYCKATGRSSVPDMNWYFAYNLFRLVGILQGIKKRIIDGNASSENAQAKAAMVEPLARQALAFAKKAGA
ncbi:phosphotransferase family protein [Aurantiacibacter poecillastricola]|uniref:phosphotransferase family protein n=1 Tax=Aurantiacibacter poecillastricola TaxID=3064385 RepID=UPI00273CFD8C|nr:phosphotransferase family protein [Aurantiacibacter sp. 219JJ12-13]MDP5261342.1 phosphotransferase family protein [Aurantiacibacter sp. 219JJ12-13]